MSDNIIDLREARAKRMKTVGSYFVRIDLYDEGVGGEVQIPDMGPEELRSVSEQLFVMARHVRDQAWEQTQDPDDRQLSVTRIYGSSRVNCWTSNDLETPDQFDWLERCFTEAAEASKP